MYSLQQRLSERLASRLAAGQLRTLRIPADGIDFYSNDYLGMAANPDFQMLLAQKAQEHPESLTGSTGSRLISGNSLLTEAAEQEIAALHHTEAALLFPSGYTANLALFSCLLTRHDTLLIDEQVHRSVHDGCKLSPAVKWKFRHNDTQHLEQLLKKATGHTIIAIESLYSMAGDFAPLQRIVELAAEYNASLIVDEAHSMGVWPYGLVQHLGLHDNVYARVVTYGKAMGVHGAAILGNRLLKDFMVNYASPFIYSTAMPDFHSQCILAAYHFRQHNSMPATMLQNNISYFRSCGPAIDSDEQSPVQVIHFASEKPLQEAYSELKELQIQTYAVFPPTVKPGRQLLRICLHAFNTTAEIEKLCNALKQFSYA